MYYLVTGYAKYTHTNTCKLLLCSQTELCIQHICTHRHQTVCIIHLSPTNICLLGTHTCSLQPYHHILASIHLLLWIKLLHVTQFYKCTHKHLPFLLSQAAARKPSCRSQFLLFSTSFGRKTHVIKTHITFHLHLQKNSSHNCRVTREELAVTSPN